MLFRTAARTLRRRHYYTTDFGIKVRHQPLTKVVATIGPTSEQSEPLAQCVAAGMNVMRLNFSHATPEEVELRIENLKDPNVGILLDTKGPELRTGKLLNDASGHDTIDLHVGATVQLHAKPDSLPEGASTATDLLIDFPPLPNVLEPGRMVLLDDGALALQVTQVKDNQITATVQVGGSVRSRAGVHLPKSDTAEYLPALSDKDRKDIEYGMRVANIDFVAASFVQTAGHVNDMRAHLTSVGQSLDYGPLPQIISKIETASSLTNFDAILEASDGIMVARGDLGVEVPMDEIILHQKEMIRACNAAGKPVIVATQMMESMGKKPIPTRAEVADVTNAVLDGADAVMLSGESAKGKYPSETIATMKKIVATTESKLQDKEAVGILTSLEKAPQVAKARPNVPIYVDGGDHIHPRLLRQVCLHRGVFPKPAKLPDNVTSML